MIGQRISGDALGRRVGLALALVTVGLVLVSASLYIARLATQDDPSLQPGGTPAGFAAWVQRVWPVFDVHLENSVPTWFNAFLWSVLGVSALLAAFFARRRFGWLLVAAIALWASLDETVSLHERLQDVGWSMALALGWRMTYAWVLPGLVLAAVVAAVLWPFLRDLPVLSRRLIGTGGAVFLFGAIVLETISGELVGHFGEVTWHVMALTHVEEAFEKLGIVLAIMGVLRLFSLNRAAHGGWTVTFADRHRPSLREVDPPVRTLSRPARDADDHRIDDSGDPTPSAPEEWRASAHG